MPDPLQQDALRRTREFVESRVTVFSLRPSKLHLDEFVVIECAAGFRDDCRGNPVLADKDDGVERMAETPEILALTF